VASALRGNRSLRRRRWRGPAAGEPSRADPADLGRVEPVGPDHHRHRRLAEPLVGDRHHRDRPDTGDAGDDALGLLGWAFEDAGDDHVPGPADDRHGAWLRGAGLGFPFGVLPSGGAELPTFLSYTYEKRRSRGREEFGKGAIEGVAGPEAANNASFSGVLVPLLTLGLPTSATAAVLLAAFQIFNLQPGPQFMSENPDLVWAIIASLFIGNVMLLALNLPLIRLWVKVLQIPRPVLYGGILVFATLGIYAVSGTISDILLAYVIGIVALFMRLYDFPIAPAILGAILGPELELQFRRSLTLTDGDLSVFVTRPLTVAILLLALAALLLPYLPRVLARLRGRPADRVHKLAFADED
jgi:putative tricarboxylic transport membrane protein